MLGVEYAFLFKGPAEIRLRVRDFLCCVGDPLVHGLWLLSTHWSGCFLFDMFPIFILNFIFFTLYTNMYFDSQGLKIKLYIPPKMSTQ